MPQPNPELALVDLRKLTEYCFNLEHPVGRHKAAVFRRALGWTARDAGTLRGLLLQAAGNCEAVRGLSDQYGQRYTVDFLSQPPLVPRRFVPLGWSVWLKTSLASSPVLCYRVDDCMSIEPSIHLLDTVALVHDLPALSLVAGEVGAIVEILADGVFEVEFCDEAGRTYGLHTLKVNQLLALRTKGQPFRTPLKAA